MRTRLASLLILLVCLTAPLSAQTSAASSDARETWMGVYLGDQKIGYLKMSVARAKYKDQDALSVESFVHTNMKMLGVEVRQDIKILVYTDPSLKPLHEDFQMSSGGSTSKVEAEFLPDKVQCKLISQGTTSEKTVPIPAGVSLLGDPSFSSTTPKRLIVGDKNSFYYFNPLSLNIDNVSTEVLRQEQVKLKDKTYDCFVVKSTMPLGETTTWQEENGEVVKMLGMMGMMMVRESQLEAMSTESDYRPPNDFAVLTSVKANTDMSKSARVSRLKLSLTGLGDKSLVISDARQKATWSQKQGVGGADYVITAKRADGARTAMLPFRSDDFQPYLAAAPYIQSDDPSIKKQAAAIVGKEKRAFYAASKIRKWVHDHMRTQADMGVVRSAVDVMNNKAGVCRDYAIFYTALARAAGIPTRITAGLVFFNGSFYYHAWAESYTGEWTPFDATLATDFVDATHIKLTQGDATSMFEIARVIGGLKAQIIDYEYLEK